MGAMKTDSTEPNFLSKISNSFDRNIKGVQYGLYGLGVTGLCLALRSVRPFQKFSRPRSIPRSFIERHVSLRGVVKTADTSNRGTVLQVAHEPVIALGRSGEPHLPVTLAGVSPSQLGLSWLQITLKNQPVTFTVLDTNSQAALASVTHQGRDVSCRLVELGLARVVPFDKSLEKNDVYKRLYSKLLRSERHAERHGNGMWHGSAPLHWRMLDRLASRLRRFVQMRTPKISVPLFS